MTRGDGFNTIPPITFAEIQAWVSVTKNRPTPAEVKLIRDLDIQYISVMLEKGSGNG